MTPYIIRRVLWLIPVLLVVSIVTFGLMHTAPGGPWDRDSDQKPLPAHIIARLNKQFNLDKPIHEQYLLYMWGAVRGDLGPSYSQPGKNVGELIADRIPYSARLGVQALFLALLVGLPLGVIAALRQNTWVDYLALFISTIGSAVPSFVLGIYLIIIFAVGFDLFPVAAQGEEAWRDPRAWVLPTIALAVGPAAYIARLTRSSILEILRQDYVRTARAKGLRENVVVVRHVLKNAMIPVWTVLGPITAGLITGSFVIEQVFSVPGVGRFFVSAITQRDYSMIMGTTLFYALMIALGNLIIDVTYGLFDPRIKVSK
ncbi:MAG: ABC transporter permease [Chloroflexia bacterium]